MDAGWITTRDRPSPYNAEPTTGKACVSCGSSDVELLDHFSAYSGRVHGTDPMSDPNKKFEKRKCRGCGQKWERRWIAADLWVEIVLK